MKSSVDAEVATQASAHLKTLHQKATVAFHGQIKLYDWVDIQVGRLWDSLSFVAGGSLTPTHCRFFDNVEQSSGKTYTETNLIRNGRLDAPEAFTFNRILFTFSRNSSDDDVFAIAEGFAWEFWRGKKITIHGVMIAMQTREPSFAPFRICEFCKSVYVQDVSCPGCGARQFQLSDSGESSASPGRQFFMDVPDWIPLVNQMSFCCALQGRPYTFKHDLKIWCHLEGLHLRGVS